MHALQFYFHATVSADLFFFLTEGLANHDFGFFAQTWTLLYTDARCRSFPRFSVLMSHFPFPLLE